MQYCSYHPAPPLDEFVDYFWVIIGGEVDRKERILPSGTSELVFNLNDDHVRIHDPIQPELYERLSGAVVAGAYSGVFICDAMQHQSMLGVHFRPGGAFPFLGVPATELTDSHANLESLWGQRALGLREQLCEATTAPRRFQLMEEALIDRFRRAPKRHRATEVALQLIGATNTGVAVREIAREVGLCQRRFIQLFSAQVGLTPKLLLRVLRFQRARAKAEAIDTRRLACCEQEPAPNWAVLASACGYYDQSHLINDFQEMSGLSPAEYLRRLRQSRRLKNNHVPLHK